MNQPATTLPVTGSVIGLETIPQFVTRNAATGEYPATPWALRGLHRNRRALGLSDAFKKVGRRWLVNRAVFYARLNSSGSAT